MELGISTAKHTLLQFVPRYKCIALSRVQRINITVGVVKGAIPQVLCQLKSHFSLCQRHLLTMPYVDLATKIKHQHLDVKQE